MQLKRNVAEDPVLTQSTEINPQLPPNWRILAAFARMIVNLAIRMVYPFMPEFSRALLPKPELISNAPGFRQKNSLTLLAQLPDYSQRFFPHVHHEDLSNFFIQLNSKEAT